MTTPRTKAGDNERRFLALFKLFAPTASLLGKQRFAAGEVEISVDQSFQHEGTEYLVEIDSGNMAKLLVGQYVLLNHLHPKRDDLFFLVVHTYKNYNPMRTIHNLHLVNEQLFNGTGIAFGAVHFDTLTDLTGGIPALLSHLTLPNLPLNSDPIAAR